MVQLVACRVGTCPTLYRTKPNVIVSLRKIVPEAASGGGLLCGADRIVRKVDGLDGAEYTTNPARFQLMFEAGYFCQTNATLAPPSVLDEVRRGKVQFFDDGHRLQGRGSTPRPAAWLWMSATRRAALTCEGRTGDRGRRSGHQRPARVRAARSVRECVLAMVVSGTQKNGVKLKLSRGGSSLVSSAGRGKGRGHSITCI